MVKLKINEIFQNLIPRLSYEEFRDLEHSILDEGIRDPICVWDSVIVDGHHRYELAKKHNLSFEVIEMSFTNEADAKIWIMFNQMSRRNIQPFVRAEMAIALEHLYAAKAKVINEQINPKLFGLEHGADIKKLKTDTREEIAKAANVSHGYIFNVKQILNRNPNEETLFKLRSGELTPGEVQKSMRREEKEFAREEKFKKTAANYKPTKDIKIIHADFYDWCNDNIETDSIDLILTDPPYPKEYLYLWDELGEVAERVLKPNRYLVTYSGQLYLDRVMSFLAQHLSYCWVISLYHSGPTQSVHPRNVICTWKPILIYKKGEPGKFDIDIEYVVDSFNKDYRDKQFHEWGQGESAVGYLMDKFSKPGELVLDPFVGGGTTLVVAADRKRKCIGIEIDEQYMDKIKTNLMKPTIASLV